MSDPPDLDARGLPRAELPVSVEQPSCAVCGGMRFFPLVRDARDWVWKKSGSFDVERCLDCGHGMTRPRPTAAGLGWYYEETYAAEGKRAVDGARFYDSRLGQLLISIRLRVLATRGWPLGPEDRLCDVGCSHGYFLAEARRRSGCAAAGCDVSAGSIAAARDRDRIDYRHGGLSEAGFAAQRFTVISFIECLEHERDPAAALAEAYRLLQPGGHLLVELPNLRCPWRWVFGRCWLPLLVPQHLSHFTPGSLARLVRARGFEILRQRGMFFPGEATISLVIALAQLLGVPGARPSLGRRLLDGFNALWLLAFFLCVDLPSQALLALFRRSGHQVLLARRPTGSEDVEEPAPG